MALAGAAEGEGEESTSFIGSKARFTDEPCDAVAEPVLEEEELLELGATLTEAPPDGCIVRGGEGV